MKSRQLEQIGQLMQLRLRAAEARLGAMRRAIDTANAQVAHEHSRITALRHAESVIELQAVVQWQRNRLARIQSERKSIAAVQIEADGLAQEVARHMGQHEAWTAIIDEHRVAERNEAMRRQEDAVPPRPPQPLPSGPSESAPSVSGLPGSASSSDGIE